MLREGLRDEGDYVLDTDDAARLTVSVNDGHVAEVHLVHDLHSVAHALFRAKRNGITGHKLLDGLGERYVTSDDLQEDVPLGDNAGQTVAFRDQDAPYFVLADLLDEVSYGSVDVHRDRVC